MMHTAVSFRLSPLIATLFLFLPLTLAAQQPVDEPIFRLLSPQESGITFSNVLVETPTFYMSVFIYAYNGSGVAIGDVNGDDLPDIYLAGTQAHSPSRLYLNRGGLRFEDISERAGVFDTAGVRFGVSMVDIDADNDLDIYVCRQNLPNRLYINNGDLTFTDRAAAFGLDYCCSSTQASFFDYDRDGDLDLYLGINGLAYEKRPMVKGLTDRFFRNDNDRFIDVTEQTGIADQGYALSVSAGDVNDDGWPDVYVTNDFQERDLLYINNRDGTFTDSMRQMMRHTSASSMGSDIADINNDGRLDIMAVDMVPEKHIRKMSNASSVSTFSPTFDSSQLMRNTLQINRGSGHFSDVAQLSGVSETDWSWGPLMADFDNDGDKDIYITNGFKRDVQHLDVINYFDPHTSRLSMLQLIPQLKLPNYIYRNDGDLAFTNVSNVWDSLRVVNANGIACADLDRDGDLDIVTNNLDTTAFLLENRASQRSDAHYLQITLQGKGRNTYAIGARVTLHTGNHIQMQEVMPMRGYLSSSDYLLHFGIGAATSVDSIVVVWPDGATETVANVAADSRLRLRATNASPPSGGAVASPSTLFTALRASDELDYRHEENDYFDFYMERLIPRRYSRNGPGIAVGDVDGDGRDDLWIGGAMSLSGTIFRQDAEGRMVRIEQPDLMRDNGFEDQAGLLIDIDGDGDRDLIVTTGGGDITAGELSFAMADACRLYLNDGNGSFRRDTTRMPSFASNSSCVVAGDYDRDGDIDLFVAGRVTPGSYPDIPPSALLRNDPAGFVDVTDEVAPALRSPGMISSALWTDYDNDNDLDLFVVGEWMTPRIYENDDGGLTDATKGSGLEGYEGWWNSLVGGDFDSDGDIDYALGNLGLNAKRELHASPDYPLRLYANDFDGNGSRDLVASYYEYGRELPTRNKQDAATQMGTYIKRKFPTTTEYAAATIQQIYPQGKLDSAVVMTATTMASMMAENRGDGTFRLSRLPIEAQISPIHGMVADDFDADGQLDILLVDNFFGPDGTVVLYDAGIGLLLHGNGDGTFDPVEMDSSGFRVTCDSRGLATLLGAGDSLLVIALCNTAEPRLFRWNGRGGKVVRVAPHTGISHAIIEYDDGRKRRHEFHIGSGYMSQNPALLIVPDDHRLRRVTLYRGDEEVHVTVGEND